MGPRQVGTASTAPRPLGCAPLGPPKGWVGPGAGALALARLGL
jgi:hypothetical protein